MTADTVAGGRTASKLLLLLRSCSVRFTAYYWVGFTVGLSANGRLDVRWGLLGVPMWLAYCLGTESVNRLADREADVINRPERTRLCEKFGWGWMTAVAVVSWLVFALIGVIMVWAHPGYALPAILMIDAGVAIGYSIGPAFKRHRVPALLALTAPLITPLLTGWAVYGGAARLRAPVLPMVVVLAAFSLGLSGIKDITDVKGDAKLNYHSLWLALVRLRRGVTIYTMVGAPALLVVVFAVFGGLRPVTAAVVPLTALSAVVVVAAARAETPEDRAAAREVMHQHTFYFLVLFLLTAVPNRPSTVAVLVSIVFWIVSSKSLHWSGGLTKARLRRWLGLFAVTHAE